MKVNGAAAKLVTIGDPLIVLAYMNVNWAGEGMVYEEAGYPKKVDGRKI